MNISRILYAVHAFAASLFVLFPAWNVWLGQKCSSTVSPLGAGLGRHFLFDLEFFRHATPNFDGLTLELMAIAFSLFALMNASTFLRPGNPLKTS